MARKPSPWYWEGRGEWYVTIGGKRHRLGPDKGEAERSFHRLMAEEPKGPAQPIAPDGLTVAEVFEKFLDWCEKNRTRSTYEWYSDRLNAFVQTLDRPAEMAADRLRPFHVAEWVDGHPSWGDTYRRGAIIAVQRAYNWAEEMGHASLNPVRKIKKPAAKRRENPMMPADFEAVRDKSKYDSAKNSHDDFGDLLEFSYHSGCRPQEARLIEVRHVNLDTATIEIPPDELHFVQFAYMLAMSHFCHRLYR